MSMDFKQLQENWNNDKENRKPNSEYINSIYNNLNIIIIRLYILF